MKQYFTKLLLTFYLIKVPVIYRVPQPTRALVVCDRGRKTKPKIILAKFSPSLSLGSIRFQRSP